MPSQPLDPGWNFSSVYELIDADFGNVDSPALRAEPRPQRTPKEGGFGLGDFDKLFRDLGWSSTSIADPLPPIDESDLSTSDDALLPSPLLEPVASCVPVQLSPTLNAEVVAFTETPTQPLSKKQRQKARKKAEKARQELLATTQELENNTSSQELVRDQLVDAVAPLAAQPPQTPSRALSNLGAKGRAASPVKAPTFLNLEPPHSPIIHRPSTKKRAKSSTLNGTLNAQAQVQYEVPVTDHTLLSTPAPQQQRSNLLSQPLFSTPSGRGLVPRTVRPTIVPRQSLPACLPTTPASSPFVHAIANAPPIVIIRPQVDRHFNLFNKLMTRFPEIENGLWLHDSSSMRRRSLLAFTSLLMRPTS